MKFSMQSKTSLQSFMITFFASLAIFAIIAFVVFKLVAGQITDKNGTDKMDNTTEAGNAPEGEVTEDVITADNSLSFLIGGYNITGDSMEAMTIVNINKESKKVTVFPINTDAKVCVGYTGGDDSVAVNVRLGDLCRFKKNDLSYIAEKVTAITAINIDSYVFFTADSFIKAVDILNENKAFKYTVAENMAHTYVDEPENEALKKYNIDFKKGDVLTSGIDLYNLLRYEGDSSSNRMSRQAVIARDMLRALLTSQITNNTLSGAITTFDRIHDEVKVKTDLAINTFLTENFDLLLNIFEYSFETDTSFKGHSFSPKERI